MPGKGLKCLKQFDKKIAARLLQLAKLRGETPKETVRKFGRTRIRMIPAGIAKHTDILLKGPFVESGERDGLPYVRLANGRIFYGYPSHDRHKREFEYLADKLPPALTPETYLLAKDVAMRYLRSKWYVRQRLPGPGGTIVEVGAYLGHKTMRFVDQHVTASGKVLAIEILPQNIPILKRNIAENGFDGCIDVMQCGVWNEPGQLTVNSLGRQRNSLVDLDHLDGTSEVVIPTDTLDNILARWDRPMIDFLVISVNGAEVEVLQGLDKELHRVRYIYVAAHFTRDGKPTRGTCCEILKAKGCTILDEGGDTSIYAQASSVQHAAS